MKFFHKISDFVSSLYFRLRYKKAWWESMEFYHDRFGYVQPYQKNAAKKFSFFYNLKNTFIKQFEKSKKRKNDPFDKWKNYHKHVKKASYFKRHKSFIFTSFFILLAGLFFVYIPFAFVPDAKQNNIDNDLHSAIGGFSTNAKLSKKELQKLEQTEKKKDELMKEDISEDDSDPEDKKNTVKKITYRVRKGETLSAIAKKFRVSIGSIAGSSGIRVIDELSSGTILTIPTQNGFFYTVGKGSRLHSILQKYKVDYNKFVELNPDINPDLLRSGDEIFLPGAKPKNLVSGWLRPVASRKVTSPYGWRWLFGRKNYHKGIDLKAPYVSVRAAKKGKVKYAGWLGSYGKVVILTHGNGYQTMYAHLSQIYVRKGMWVSRGRTLGRSGNTGYSFGPHLHFEITRYGKNINPAIKIKGLRYSRRRR